MKIRNILSVLFVGLLFTSCNSEEEVQRGNEDGRDISFSMTLTLGEVTAMTKAGGDIAEGYTYSTEDEVKVNNVVVAIFNEANGTVGECLEYKSVAFDGGIPNSTVTIDGKKLSKSLARFTNQCLKESGSSGKMWRKKSAKPYKRS